MLGTDEPNVTDSEVLDVVAPTRLEMTWGADTLLWILESVEDGTHLVLRHTFDKRDDAPSFGAGWHLCLDGLTRHLAGQVSPPVAGNAAIDNGWANLAKQYADLWSVEFKTD